MTCGAVKVARLPLADTLILEAVDAAAPAALTQAAGMCGRVAADLGARVLRIDVAPEADRSPTDLFLHGGKERVPVQPATAAALIADVASRADAVICDPAIFAAQGEAWRALPIILAMARDAPLAGSELTIEAQSGLLDLIGDPAREPLRLGGHQTAYAAGLAAYLGLVAGLTRRSAGLAAGPVRITLLDVAVWLNWKTLAMSARTGTAPSRSGAQGEWTIIACADGHFALVYRVPEWPLLVALAGDPRLEEPRFQTPSGRREHRPQLNAILSDAFATRTRAEIRKRALALKLPLGPVWTPEELLRDPHMTFRSFFAPVTVVERRLAMPRLPVMWNGRAFPPAIAARAPAPTGSCG
jgi:crotonobetainyl-CoA:carnitine CoA-transferase CaiB-like acyl-CoA transferase